MRHRIVTMLGLKLVAPALMLCLAESSSAAEIPIDVGAGPALFFVPEKLQAEDQPIWGVHLEANAVIDKKTIDHNKGQIPAAFRRAAENVDEARVGYLLVPDALFASPPHRASGLAIYGATWRPFAVGLPIVAGPLRFSLGTGLLLTYAHVDVGDYKIVDTGTEGPAVGAPSYVSQVTNFFRPGADIRAEFELKLAEAFLVSLGGASAYYVPQKIGGTVGQVGDHLDRSLWRISQAYLMFHYRFPVHVSL